MSFIKYKGGMSIFFISYIILIFFFIIKSDWYDLLKIFIDSILLLFSLSIFLKFKFLFFPEKGKELLALNFKIKKISIKAINV